MNNKNLMILGIGALALFLFSKNNSASSDTGDSSIPSAPVYYYQQNQNPVNEVPVSTNSSSEKFNSPVINVQQSSLDLSATSYTAPNRFTKVSYDGGQSFGVLDRAAQQSITMQEAAKRANNPFNAALGKQSSSQNMSVLNPNQKKFFGG